MNAHDQDRIDTVLQALGQAEPAAGMQQRITAALHRAEPRSNAKANRWPPGLRFPHSLALPRLAVATAVVAAAAALLLQARHRARPDDAHRSATASVRQPVRGSTGKATSGLQKSSTSEFQAVAASPLVHHQAHAPAGDASPQHATEERSFPAPPLPLTEQERLLIRLVHREAPIQLAQLTTPAILAARQQATDEVTAFFAPHLPLVIELQAPAEPPPSSSSNPAQNSQHDVPKEIQ